MAYVEGSTLSRNRVRLLVGDISTSTSGEYLHDGAYDFFITEGRNIYVAAQLAANSLAARFTGIAGSSFEEKQVGDLRLKRGDAMGLAKNYRDLAHKFGRMSAGKTSPYAGGISKDDKRTVEQDADRVEPFFSRRLLDNRRALNPTAASTST